MMKRSAIMAAIAGLLWGRAVSIHAGIAGRRYDRAIFDDYFTLPNYRRTCRKTVSAAALKRAAKKRANKRARSPK